MSSQPVEAQGSIRFGDDLELDMRVRRLRRGSRVVKLERIPLEILVLLVNHPGEIVTRDQVVSTVWGNDVFFDTDNSIRGAIRKIRQALKDDPENPRFIQTITGRGYRFIAPVISAEENRLEVPAVTEETESRNDKPVRALLGDSAEKPRFVETLPKRGYRFLATVEPVAGSVPARAAQGLRRLPSMSHLGYAVVTFSAL